MDKLNEIVASLQLQVDQLKLDVKNLQDKVSRLDIRTIGLQKYGGTERSRSIEPNYPVDPLKLKHSK
jgi:hypothetical protein